jgi:hypothetical protein
VTPEEQAQYVEQRLREVLDGHRILGVGPDTAEDVMAANDVLMTMTFEVLHQNLQEAKAAGVKVGDVDVTVQYRFDQDLGVGRIQEISIQSDMSLPHPLKRFCLRFDTDGIPTEPNDD